jgi:hypothetical protein
MMLAPYRGRTGAAKKWPRALRVRGQKRRLNKAAGFRGEISGRQYPARAGYRRHSPKSLIQIIDAD